MTQALELLLDPAAEERVVEHWRVLEEAGLGSQARHPGATNRPHVTVAALPAVPPAAEAVLAAGCAAALPLEVRLGALAVLGGRDRVALVRMLVPTADLLALHAAVVAPLDVEQSLSAPGRWLPHVTLALRMPVEQLPAAVAALGPLPDDLVRLERARRWDGDAKAAWDLV